MKIEFLPDGAEACPLIRLYDFRPAEVRTLCEVCIDLAEGCRSDFALHDQLWVESIGACRFFWCANDKNFGVKLPRDGKEFVLLLSGEAWREVEGKLQSFAGDWTFGGFNWLTNEGDVEVLISHSGGW
jgi:hypothetical protein